MTVILSLSKNFLHEYSFVHNSKILTSNRITSLKLLIKTAYAILVAPLKYVYSIVLRLKTVQRHRKAINKDLHSKGQRDLPINNRAIDIVRRTAQIIHND